MAGPQRRTAPAVAERLRQEPQRFELFQAVRLLERLALARGGEPVGGDALPGQEAVRLRVPPGRAFPPSAVAGLDTGKTDAPPQLAATCLGLTGPNGTLPAHYATLLLRRQRLKDFALRDFLDLFHHRALSLLQRAWAKYRPAIAWEQARLRGQSDDPLSTCLHALVGLGTAGLSGRLAAGDEVVLFYGGHFAHRPRNAVALQLLLAEWLELPVAVAQFQGRWLYLEEAERTRLGTQFARLGVDAVAGERVWEVQSSFRLRLGPLDYRQFRRLLPDGAALPALCQLTRLYCGAEFAFEVQLLLRAAQVPQCRLGWDARLGWNTWLGRREREADEAVFRWDGI